MKSRGTDYAYGSISAGGRVALQQLRRAFDDRELTLYLGAGVSMPSGLPGWDQLVLTMYLAALGELERHDNPLKDWRVFPNYLEAIAEWLLGTNVDSPEITAQKIRSMVPDDAAFVELLKETLYAPIRASGTRDNTTLRAVQKLCSDGGVRAVISYNYDDLVEYEGRVAGAAASLTPVWFGTDIDPVESGVPVFHVHGFLPRDGDGSRYEELILTEEQFHAAASDPYSWSNLVQMRQLGSNVGLMIGMSLADRNLRRILEAMRKLPDLCPQYAILRDERLNVSDEDLEQIEQTADRYGRQRKVGAKGRDQIRAILDRLYDFDVEMKTQVLGELGVEVIWLDDFQEIPQLLTEIGLGA